MNFLKSLLALSVVFLLTLLTMGGRCATTAETSVQSTAPVLEASIAAPVNNFGNRSLYFTAHPFIDVVIRNASDRPVKFWVNTPLTLEILAIDGRALPDPIVVSASSNGGRHWEILTPGDVFVRRLNLHKYKPGEERIAKPGLNYGQDYMGFPSFLNYHDSPGGVRSVRMRAVFQSDTPNGPGKDRIWSGRVVSETRDYNVFDVDYDQWK